MAETRKLRLGAFMRPVSLHTGAWRYPGAYADANFNFAPSEEFRAKARSREVRRLLHGRPSGRPQHADRGAEAQPHGHIVRAVHAAFGAGRGDRAHRPGRHGLDHLRRALSCRPPLRLARPYQRRPRRLEHRHHVQPGCGAQFRPRRACRAWRALSPRPRILRRGDRPVGQFCRRRLHPRCRQRALFRSGQAACARPQGAGAFGERPAQHRAAAAGLAGDRAGRRFRSGPAAGGRNRRGGVRSA